MITEDYVSFEVAKLLKEKGFDWPCHGTYDTAVTGGKPKFSEYEVLSYFPYGMKNSDDKYDMVISAPTLQMAMKWLREVHNLFIEIQCYGCECDEKAHFEYSYVISEYVEFNNNVCTTFGLEKRYAKSQFLSYEEACEAAIKYCLENLI